MPKRADPISSNIEESANTVALWLGRTISDNIGWHAPTPGQTANIPIQNDTSENVHNLTVSDLHWEVKIGI